MFVLMAKEWWLSNGNNGLPTPEELENVWNFDFNNGQHNMNGRQLHILEWYLDKYMPAAAGADSWDVEKRTTHFVSSKQNCSITGKEKVLVTASNEAFGLLTYKNGRDKWTADFSSWTAIQTARSCPNTRSVIHPLTNASPNGRAAGLEGGPVREEAGIPKE